MHRGRVLLGKLTLVLGMVTAAGCLEPLPPATAQPDAGTMQPDSGGGGDPHLVDKMISDWSGCMTLDHFTLSKMTDWGNIPTSTGQDCAGCHFGGYEGFIADREATPTFFAGITTQKQFLTHYFLPDVGQHKMVINTTGFQGVATGAPGHEGHPRFDPVNNPGMTALKAFYDVTALQQGSNQCGAPTIPPP